MKVYVVTEGSYSSYHIVFVTLDKARADVFVKRYNKTDYDDYRVEEYDTDVIKLFDDGRKLYQVWKRDNDVIRVYEEKPCYQDDFIMNKVKRYNVKNPKSIQYSVHVMAEDEEHAEKIGADLIAEYMARKAYIT